MRLAASDVVRVGVEGLRSRPARALLSALGVAIGIATMVAVVGISASSRADLLDQLDRLGTGLLRVAPGDTVFGGAARLPKTATRMVRAVEAVESVASTGLTGVPAYRTGHIPQARTAGLLVQAATADLLRTLKTPLRQGRWLNAATERQRAVVLGALAAGRLGAGSGDQVWIGGQWWTVVGVLDNSTLAAEIDRSVLIGFPAAEHYLAFDGHPTTIYTRAADEHVVDVRAVLARTVNPEHPEEVKVSRPSDALAARAAATDAFTGVLLGVGAVALLVGGVGVANTMVISVLERRREIGLRRALGATRGQVRTQFLTESLLLSVLGGAAGAVCGAAVTLGFAAWRDLQAVIPLWALGGGLAATLVVGAAAGILPAMRAARLPPTLALATA
ncbi:ABC transporter permease [Nonomuraea sp. LP-02]|uniref:ABC transporter permease n=1 Tax=Nonomuraea sp. LP-02 TaxID=3097960 RepID=UPI002E2FC107|nr:ABC transporter permease [Nonomuraea sp. LP-02]MED7925237.1 ABC transporter permease [Nonomuraea sp. LP-02]